MPKKKPLTYWQRVMKNLEAERDAALAGQRSLQRRLDEANTQNTAHEGYAARLRAEHDKATARLRTEHEDVVLRYATRENELRKDLDECITTLRANGWEHSLALGWYRTSVRAAGIASVPMAPLQPDPARHEAAMHALKATPFGYVACVAIVNAIRAYLNPRSQSDPSAAEAPYGPESSPDVMPPQGR